MSVENETSRVAYTGNGSTTAFAFGYPFELSADLVVKLVNTATAVETLQVLDTDYTVTGAGNPAGGTVTMTTAPTASQKLVIYRDPPVTQELELSENDPLPVDEVEKSLDKLTFVAQRIVDMLSRAFRLPDGYTGAFDPLLPGLVEADKYLKVNADGDGWEYADPPADGADGAAGANGTNGALWYTGSGVPAGGTGADGDYYIRSNGDVYGPKASGSWGSVIFSLVGPTGATGATGPAGTNGTNGTNGADGVGIPAGGTASQVLRKIDGTDYNTEWADPATSADDTAYDATSWNGVTNVPPSKNAVRDLVEGPIATAIAAKADASALAAHLADTTDAHDASAISYPDSTGFYSASDVATALDEAAAAILAITPTNTTFTGTAITPSSSRFQKHTYTGASVQTFTGFGALAGVADGTEIDLVGTDDTNYLSLAENDATNGWLMNGPYDLTRGRFIRFKKDATNARMLEIARR